MIQIPFRISSILAQRTNEYGGRVTSMGFALPPPFVNSFNMSISWFGCPLTWHACCNLWGSAESLREKSHSGDLFIKTGSVKRGQNATRWQQKDRQKRERKKKERERERERERVVDREQERDIERGSRKKCLLMKYLQC